jgi:hypothetical protein
VTRHIAHFNWATLVADLEDRRVAPFVNAVPKVNAIAERSPGFVWRSGGEAERVRPSAGRSSPKTALIASFSVWETPEHFRDYVYKTVHGAFFRRGHEWFEPDRPRGHVLWWVEAGHIPDIAEARDKVDAMTANGPGPEAFDFGWLDAQAA